MMTKRSLIAIVVLVCASSAARAQTVTDSIRMLDSAWARSYATNDTTLALELYSPRLIFTATDGRTKTRSDELADVRATPGLTMHYFRTSDVRIEAYTQTVVVAGTAEWSFTYNGNMNTVKRRYTAFYVRGGPKGWQIVGMHMGQAPR